MKSTVEALEGNKVKVVVEVEEAEFEKDLDAAFKRLAQEVRLPGFRPGKAPRKVLEARIGQSYAREEAFRSALPNYYVDAVKEHDVDVIAPPEIDITNGQDDGPVAFDAVVQIRPSITVEGYQSLEIELPSIEVSEEDVDEAVDRMRGNFGELQTVDRAAAEGDRAVIDIETMHGEEPVAGLTAEAYAYEVGSGAVVPELDEQLTGAVAGQELEFTAEHPDDDEDELLEFSITVQEIQENVLPEPTDEWAAENSEFESLEALRADFRTNLETARINQAVTARRSKIGEALAELVDDELVPEAMVDMEVENRVQDMDMRLRAQGMSIDQFLQMTGQAPEEMLGGLREQAAGSAKLDLALRSIADNESIEISDEEVDEQLSEVAEQVERSLDDVRDEFVEAGRLSALRSDLLKSKALDWVTDRANLVDEDGQQVSPDALQLPTQDEESDDAAAPETAAIESGEDDQ